jgi:heme oxygenase
VSPLKELKTSFEVVSHKMTHAIPATRVLRERTQVRHTALERTPLACDLMSHQLTPTRYVEILNVWVSAWAALEDCIANAPCAAQVETLLPPRRARLGQEDLQYWLAQGYAKQPISAPIGHAFSQLGPTDKAGLLGVCYVARGASLGGQVIARHLTNTLALNEGRGIAFFAPGEEPALTWPQWSHALDAQLDTPAAVERAVLWADATFAALETAFSGTTA